MGTLQLPVAAVLIGACVVGAASPLIVEQPTNVWGGVGRGIQLCVTAACDQPMFFTWQFQPLDTSAEFMTVNDSHDGRITGIFSSSPPGTHTRALEISPTIISDEGLYRVEVRCGGDEPVYSTAATVLLGEFPPEPFTAYFWRVYEHTPLIRIAVPIEGGGLGTRHCQWFVDRRDGNGRIPIGEAMAFSNAPDVVVLELADVSLHDAGLYNLEITDDRPGVLTLPQDIEVQIIPHLNNVYVAGVEGTVRIGELGALRLEVSFAGGIPPYAVELLKGDGTAFTIIAATTNAHASPATIVLENMHLSDAGAYVVRVRDSGTDSVLSNALSIEAGEGGLCDSGNIHRADTDASSGISLNELLRVVQLFNAKRHGCDVAEPDGVAPYAADHTCCPHDADYHGGADWTIDLVELLRVVQIYNVGGYVPCPGENTEDGFCPGLSP